MNSLTFLERPAPLLSSNTLLSREGFTGTLFTFAPDSEALLPESTSTDPQLRFVVDGDIAIHANGLTTIVQRGGTCLVPPGRTTVVSSRAGEPSRVLRMEIPPRQPVIPQIITPRV